MPWTTSSPSPSCVTPKETREKKSGREIHAAIFLLSVFFRITHDGLSERDTTCCLFLLLNDVLEYLSKVCLPKEEQHSIDLEHNQ